MGTVYEAEQDQPRRAVALKVIRAGFLTPQLFKRFEYESQVLARLQHQGIAQVYEAGVVVEPPTAVGGLIDPNVQHHPPTSVGGSMGSTLIPFFAMEFIRGVPLTEYAARRNLTTRERLDLIARVCDAVYHAHQKGVIHRDLKPGNILVDETGQPKVLDFGVARAIDSDVQQTTLRTDIGQLVGTVPYMSPEQVSGDPDDLDTRSDVYALGVIAYELLAGRLPFDLSKRMIHEAARIIREEEPTRLSSINRTLRGDVETIVAHALEKDKARRYQSAESFAGDIRHFLRDEPIEARPASSWYQTVKFTRRHRGLVTGVAVAFVLLVGGLIATSISRQQAVNAREAEAAARTKADELNAKLQGQRDELQTIMQTVGAELGEAAMMDLRLPDADSGDDESGSDPRIKAIGEFTLVSLRRVRSVNESLRSALETLSSELEGASSIELNLPDAPADSDPGDGTPSEDLRISALGDFSLRAVRRIKNVNDELQEVLETVSTELGEAAGQELNLPEESGGEEDGDPRIKALGDFALASIRKIRSVNETMQSQFETLGTELEGTTGFELHIPEEGTDGEQGEGERIEDARVKALGEFTLKAVRTIKASNETLRSTLETLGTELEGVTGLELNIPDESPEGEWGEGELEEDPRIKALGEFTRDAIRKIRSVNDALQQTMTLVDEELHDASESELDLPAELAGEEPDDEARIDALGRLTADAVKRIRASSAALRELLESIASELEGVSGLELAGEMGSDEPAQIDEVKIRAIGDLTVESIKRIRKSDETLRRALDAVTAEVEGVEGLEWSVPEGEGDSEEDEPRVKALGDFAVEAVRTIKALRESAAPSSTPTP